MRNASQIASASLAIVTGASASVPTLTIARRNAAIPIVTNVFLLGVHQGRYVIAIASVIPIIASITNVLLLASITLIAAVIVVFRSFLSALTLAWAPVDLAAKTVNARVTAAV
jgi:hypothetical protein